MSSSSTGRRAAGSTPILVPASCSSAQPAKVYDVERDVPISAPADLAAWLRANPHLKVGPASPVTIAGASGEKFTASFSRSGTKNRGGCADLVPSASESFGPISLCPGDKALFAVIQVDGKSVLGHPADGSAGGLGLISACRRRRSSTPSGSTWDSTRAAARRPRSSSVAPTPPTTTRFYFAQKVAQLSHKDAPGSAAVRPLRRRAEQRAARGARPRARQARSRLGSNTGMGQEGRHELRGPAGPVPDRLAAALFRRVLTSPIAREVASGTLKVGVRGLALTARSTSAGRWGRRSRSYRWPTSAGRRSTLSPRGSRRRR